MINLSSKKYTGCLDLVCFDRTTSTYMYRGTALCTRKPRRCMPKISIWPK